MDTFTMTIDGKSRPGSRRVGVINPATGKAFAEVPDCTKAELDEAMEAARRAFPAWSRDEALRRKVLNDCAAALQANAERIAPLLTQEANRSPRPAKRSWAPRSGFSTPPVWRLR